MRMDADKLNSFVRRIERLREEKAGIAADERQVFGEAKADGFDTKAMRKVLQRRAVDPEDRERLDALIATYEEALGHGMAAAHRALSSGATLSEAARVGGVPRSTLRHSAGVSKNRVFSTDSETGKIIESGPPESSVAAKAEGNTAAPEQEPAAGAATSNDAGGPPSAPTPAAGHIIEMPSFLRRTRE